MVAFGLNVGFVSIKKKKNIYIFFNFCFVLLFVIFFIVLYSCFGLVEF